MLQALEVLLSPLYFFFFTFLLREIEGPLQARWQWKWPSEYLIYNLEMHKETYMWFACLFIYTPI